MEKDNGINIHSCPSISAMILTHVGRNKLRLGYAKVPVNGNTKSGVGHYYSELLLS